MLFKRVRVVSMAGVLRNALVCMAYPDRSMEGSPQNSVTVVPLPAGQAVPLEK